MDQQQGRHAGAGARDRRPVAQQPAGLVVEHVPVEEPRGERARLRVIDHRREVVDAVERHDAGQRQAVGGHDRGHLGAGGFADDDEAVGVRTEVTGVRVQEADRAPQALDLLRMAHVGCQRVVDRHPGDLRGRQGPEDRRDVGDAIAGFPPTAVDQQRQRVRPVRRRHPRVERQAPVRIPREPLVEPRRQRPGGPGAVRCGHRPITGLGARLRSARVDPRAGARAL